ncbi:hypothetical protein FO507_15540 [Bacillus mojavensis]|uniref:hypothetical protein n=1 Tax=Bacillus mojavensis TaxID=72360 RepID=UPI00028852A7|nr:hypothetical protein [Bacillus mojavensis]MDR4228766.1 hypothetical protein [Bacillus mojavensis]MEC1775442.1 hypothetical protein [Bacillus mojavensis]MEC3586535.1 hypothetical protein [Bacillus mojavensis]MEC5241725.1 hypothetical protein [Bacillus mojavensis]MED0749290.1 hypothetical protein [Bacillus mojavensis]
MKLLLSVIVGMLILGFFLSWKMPRSEEWIHVKTSSSQEKQFARMSGNTLQIKNVIKNDAGKETIYMTNGISGPK